MRKTIAIAIATFLTGVALVLFGGVLRESPSAGASALPADRVAAAFDPVFSPVKNAAALVLRLKQETRESPDDPAAHALLGFAYQQRARETADPTYYARSESALRRALELDSENTAALSGLTALALTRHRFTEALFFARRARELAPTEVRWLGPIGDALVNLGRYREAFAAFDELGRLKPGLAAYARVSYARELRGDRRGAIAAMRLAADSAVPGSEGAASSALHLGKLLFSGADYKSAERQYRIALAHVPGYAAALDGLALIEFARGRLLQAISLQRRAVATAPSPEHVAQLGELLLRAGRPRAAARQFAIFSAIERHERAYGVRNQLEDALVRIDHGQRLWTATAMARSAYRRSPSIDAADVVAWGLARSGRCGEANRYSKLALRLGTQDALKLFHRGMIERCLGHGSEARQWFRRAVELNPGFSVLWSPVAARYARLPG